MENETVGNLSHRALRFGTFELDLGAEQLSRGGRPIKLQPQPLKVLTYLVRNAGRLVTRMELRDWVWGQTVVEWDQGLNFCMREIRRALGDDARSPRFIETVPRRGFRFVAPVRLGEIDTERIAAASLIRPLFARSASKGVLGFAGTALVVLPVALGWFLSTSFGAASELPTLADAPATTSALALEHYQRGHQYFKRNIVYSDAVAAADMFQRAVDLDTTFAEASAMLGIARLSLSFDWGRAQEQDAGVLAVERATQLAPGAMLSALAQGYKYYYGQRDYETALIHYYAADSISPNDPRVLTPIGYVLRRQGRFSEALEYLERAFELDNGSYEIAIALATTLMRTRDYADAGRYLEHAAAVSPLTWRTYRMMALNYLLWDGNPERAYESIQRYCQIVQPQQTVLLYRLSSRLLASSYTDEIEEWDVRRDGLDSLRFYAHKAESMEQLGRTAMASALRDSANVIIEQRLARGFIDSVRDSVVLALAYASSGQVENAAEIMDGVRDHRPAYQDAYHGPELAVLKAEVLVRIGQLDEAVAMLTRALSGPSLISVNVLRSDPVWEPLHRHPGFESLIGI